MPDQERAIQLVDALSTEFCSQAPETFDLATGSAGTVLFLHYQGTILEQPELENQAVELLEDSYRICTETVETRRGLHDGLSGLAWVTEHCYQTHFGAVDPCVVVDELLLRNSFEGNPDIISGQAGIAVYFAERGNIPALERIQAELRRYVDELVSKREPDVFLGLAHGLAGYLHGLSLGGFNANKTTVSRAVTWLLTQRINGGFPRQSCHKALDRFAWCHGTAGIAICLANLAQTWNRPDWRREAELLTKLVAHVPTDIAKVTSANVCHGAMSLALILDRLGQVVDQEDTRTSSERWFRIAVEMLETEGLAQEGPGLLLGQTGIALGLLSFISPTYLDWDRCLGLSFVEL